MGLGCGPLQLGPLRIGLAMKPRPPPPSEIAWISDVIGAEATLLLVREFGGMRIRIPKEASQAIELAAVIGLDAAKKAVAAWTDDRLRIPLVRWWQARCLHAEGKSTREIARALRVTETSVPDLLHGRRHSRDTLRQRGEQPKAVQLTLFE